MGAADEAAEKSDETCSSCLKETCLNKPATTSAVCKPSSVCLLSMSAFISLRNQGIPKSGKATISHCDLIFATGFRFF